MKLAENNQNMIRINIVGSCFFLFIAAISLRAVYLQVIQSAWLADKALTQYEKSITENGKRGIIYDRNLNKLADSIDILSIGAHPGQIKNIRATAKDLASALKIHPGQMRKKLSSNNSFVWIKRKVTPAETAAIKKKKLSGIVFKTERSRYYPNKTLASQVIGFSGLDGHGLEGIEYYYNKDLEGGASKFTVLTDALGREFNTKEKQLPGYSGNNLILTIDRTIQYTTEKVLAETVNTYSAQSGMAVVMAPATGAVLALANYPVFNPNSFRSFKSKLWRNRTVTDTFEPGSTLKLFNAAAALESGLCSARTIFFCENGRYRIGGNVVHDAGSHAYGWLSLNQIIKYSSNIGAVKISEMIGAKTLYQTLSNFGFGQKTGIDCPAEASGTLMPYKKWTKIDAGAIAFGQGISVSAIQLITAVCALANKGILMKPHIVHSIVDPAGHVLYRHFPTPVRRAVSANTAQAVMKMMQLAVSEGGTGTNAALEGYSVGGKTGTAQKINSKGKYDSSKHISSFLGVAPAAHPEIAILVIIDEPQNEHYGGVVAAPAFRKIAREILDYLNIPPDRKIGTPNNGLTASLEREPSG
jgi:cell division protein FtsI (penicillin-binding protein 3)